MAFLVQALNSDPAARQQPPPKRPLMAKAAVGDDVGVDLDGSRPTEGLAKPT
jgi:hypothetical protein